MKKKELTIKDLAELLLPKLWIVVIISVLCSALAFVYSKVFKDDTYTSYVTFSVVTDNITTSDNVDVAKEMVQVYKVMIESENFLNEVISELNRVNADKFKDMTPSQLRSMMNVTQINETFMFTIYITSSNKEDTAKICEQFRNITPDKIRDEFSVKAPAIKIVDQKDATAPNSKHEIRNTVIAFFVSAILSVLAIWIFSFFDVTIRDKKKLIDNLDVPILGTIPKHELPIPTKGEDGHV